MSLCCYRYQLEQFYLYGFLAYFLSVQFDCCGGLQTISLCHRDFFPQYGTKLNYSAVFSLKYGVGLCLLISC